MITVDFQDYRGEIMSCEDDQPDWRQIIKKRMGPKEKAMFRVKKSFFYVNQPRVLELDMYTKNTWFS